MRQRTAGSWQLRVFIGRNSDGRPVQVARTFQGTKREAQTALAKMVTELQHASVTDRRGVTVARLFDAWLDHIEPHRKPSTIDRYRRKIQGRIVPALGRIRIDRLTPKRLDDQYRAWRDEGLSPSTVRLCHAHLSAALNQAVKWGWLERNPAQRASAPAQARSQARSITPDHLQRLIAAAEPDDPLLAVAVALAALTGCRRSELCALRWSDVDLATGNMHVSRAYTPVNGRRIETDTKTHQSRSIALDAVAIEVLDRRWDFQRWYAEASDVPLGTDPYILSREPTGGEPLAPHGLSHAFARLNHHVGLDCHLHELRHFTATTAIAAGADIRTVAGRLGHADPSVTLRIYAHAVEARDREVAAILGKAVRPQLTTW